MSESVKYETISLRLTKEDADLIRTYAESQRVSVSALIRSSMIRLVKQELKFSPPLKSPSPALDLLNFDARYKLLRFFDVLVGSMFASGFSVSEVENELLPKLSFTDPKLLQDLFDEVYK